MSEVSTIGLGWRNPSSRHRGRVNRTQASSDDVLGRTRRDGQSHSIHMLLVLSAGWLDRRS